MKKQTIFSGAGVAVVTPMHEDGSVYYDLFSELVRDQVQRGTDAIIVAGTTGEATTLTDQERGKLIALAVEAAHGRVPVVAGAGSNNTAHAVELSKMARDSGAQALLHVTPYYNKTSQEGLTAHFEAVNRATALPVILYNVPSRTGVNIAPETYRRLCELEHIAAVKEASGNFSQFARIADICGDRLDLYTGNDDQIVPALSLGAKGVISVLANILPEKTHDICQSYFDGDVVRSRALQLEYLDLVNALFMDVNPIPVKQAMNRMGIPVGPCRLPLCEMNGENTKKLDKVLEAYCLCAPSRR